MVVPTSVFLHETIVEIAELSFMLVVIDLFVVIAVIGQVH